MKFILKKKKKKKNLLQTLYSFLGSFSSMGHLDIDGYSKRIGGWSLALV